MVPAPPVDGTRDVERLAHTARRLLQSGGLLESTMGEERIEGHEIARVMAGHLSTGAPAAAQSAADHAVRTAERALERLAGGAPASNLTDDEVVCLEAIVLVTGRPAMRFSNGKVEMPPDLGDNGPWRVLVAISQSSIDEVAGSVGRIELRPAGASPEIVGTGWRMGLDLVVTNRHVVQQFVTDAAAQPAAWQIDREKPATIDFGPETPGPFSVTALAYVAPEDPVDLAILRLQSGAAAMPGALPIVWEANAVGRMIQQGAATVFQGKKLYVVGHPWRPVSTTAVASVFGAPDGSKRWSPGYATRLDAAALLLEHDCSTLGGSSGSCVLSSDSHAVVALHFGGRNVRELTGIGTANVALPLSALAGHPVADILRTGHI